MVGEYFIQPGETAQESIAAMTALVSENYSVEPVVTGLRVETESQGTAPDLMQQAKLLPEVQESGQTPVIPEIEDAPADEPEPQARAAASGEYAPSKVVSRAYETSGNTISFNQQYSWNDTTNKPTNLDPNWGLELEFALYNETIGNGTRPNCPSGTDDNFWAGRGVAGNDEVLLWSAVSATQSDASELSAYFDGFDVTDPCNRSGFDIGIGYPQSINPTPSYIAELATLIVTEKGNQPSSKFSARYQAVQDECFGLDRTSACMNLNLPTSPDWPGPAASNGPFLSVDRNKYVQGGFDYTLASGPTYIANCTVTGAFGSRYSQIGGGNGSLGRCDSPEYIRLPYASYTNRVQDFLNGKMYFTTGTNGWEVFGAIGTKYETPIGPSSGPTTPVGWPTSGELTTPNGQGKFNRFQNGNINFGLPVGRAHAVYGAIFGRYGQEGFEGGRFGFPTSDEFQVNGDPLLVQVNFERGWIRYNFNNGQTSVS